MLVGVFLCPVRERRIHKDGCTTKAAQFLFAGADPAAAGPLCPAAHALPASAGPVRRGGPGGGGALCPHGQHRRGGHRQPDDAGRHRPGHRPDHGGHGAGGQGRGRPGRGRGRPGGGGAAAAVHPAGPGPHRPHGGPGPGGSGLDECARGFPGSGGDLSADLRLRHDLRHRL